MHMVGDEKAAAITRAHERIVAVALGDEKTAAQPRILGGASWNTKVVTVGICQSLQLRKRQSS